ncbi:MAG: hypothetical protein GY811_05750 [Myxococcales bacterium]|nr:hypothetical protein [Myxococcales bacterium]
MVRHEVVGSLVLIRCRQKQSQRLGRLAFVLGLFSLDLQLIAIYDVFACSLPRRIGRGQGRRNEAENDGDEETPEQHNHMLQSYVISAARANESRQLQSNRKLLVDYQVAE